MSNPDIAWAAGFFDGEGCVSITRYTVRGEDRFRLVIAVGNTSVVSLEKLKSLFGGRIHKLNHTEGRRFYQHQWLVEADKASDALEQMLPFLCVKKGEAVLGIDFQSRVLGRGKKLHGAERRQHYERQSCDRERMMTIRGAGKVPTWQ